MDYFDLFVLIIELISIISFAVSGAVTAIRKNMDLFGVIIVGITTSIGGGIIRDLVLGIHPPKSFNRPIYAGIAALVALLTFIIEYIHVKRTPDSLSILDRDITAKILFWLDAVGIGIFTTVGIATAYEVSPHFNTLVLCFVGVITGVGGGLTRDILTGNPPYIFVKHFYASACIIGALVCIFMWEHTGRVISMLTGAAVVILLRYLAARFLWNMPRIPREDDAKVVHRESVFAKRK